jgi:hypothetical protein
MACRPLDIVDGVWNDGVVGKLGLGCYSISPGSILKRFL